MEVKSRLAELTFKHQQGNLTGQESQELNQLLKDPNKAKVFELVNDRDRLTHELAIVFRFEKQKEAAWQKIRQFKEPVPVKPVPKKTVRSINSWLRYSAAAVVAGLLIWGGFKYIMHNIKNNSFVNTTGPAKINHGRTYARLLLSDGTVIKLDSSNLGEVVKRGNIIIEQPVAHELRYKFIDPSKPHDINYLDTLVTEGDQQMKIIYTDTSIVELQGSTVAAYMSDMNGAKRDIYILKGEINCKVAHKAKSPFRVMKDDIKVEAVGTEFGVRILPQGDSVNARLLSGSIKVANKTEGVILNGRGQAWLTNAGTIKFIVDTINVKQGINNPDDGIIFIKEDFITVMKKLEKKYDVHVNYPAQTPEGKFTAGFVRDTSIKTILANVESYYNVHIKLQGKEIYIVP